MTSGGTVTLTSSIGSVGTVLDNGDGTYTATLTDDSHSVGVAIVSGTIGGNAIGNNATVTFTTGAASAVMSTITADPTSIDTDSGSSTITVHLKDQFGNNLTSGGATGALSSSLFGSVFSAVIDQGNGSYTATFSSPVTGPATISGTVNGGNIASTASVTVVGGALHRLVLSPASTTITFGESQTYTAQGFDSNGNSLGDKTSTTIFSIAPDGSCVGNVCTPASAGPHTVTGTIGTVSGTADLGVDTAALTVTASTNTKTYDGTTAAAASPVLTGTLGSGDVVSLSETYTGSAAGTGLTLVPAIVFTTGSAANYSISLVNDVTGVINTAALTVTASTNTKTYDGTTAAAASPVLTGTLGSGDVVSLSETYTGSAAGTGLTLVPAIVFTTGSAANYSISLVNDVTGVINTAALTVTASTNTKTYDGTTAAAASPVLTGTLGSGDVVSLSETYTGSAAGTGLTLVPAIVFTTGSAANYSISLVNDVTGVINTAALTVTASTNTKTYDGTTAAAASPVLTGTLGSGDVVSLSETYTGSAAGTGLTLVPAIVFTTGSAANYSISLVNDVTGVINTAALTVTASTNTKTYDGTTAAAASPVLTGTLGSGDVVSLSETYTGSAAGTGLTLVPAIVFTTGSAANYSISFVNDVTGVINTAALTVTASTNTKTYDGTTAAAASPVLTGTLGSGDVVSLSETYTGSAAGTGLTLVPAIVFTTGSAANYSISLVNDVTGVINTAALTVTASTNTKTYDGTTAAAASPVLTGTLGSGDVVSLSETYTGSAAGTGLTLVPAIVFTTGSAANYSISLVNDVTGVINTAALTVTASTNTKTYDGTTAAAASPITDRQPGSRRRR